MAAIEVMYRRVVYVVTGSGIGPVLGEILTPRVPARLVWSTRTPRATYGDALVDEVLAAHPDAVIWDTTERGKPDLLRLAHDVCRDFAAEAAHGGQQQGGNLERGARLGESRRAGVRADLGLLTSGSRA